MPLGLLPRGCFGCARVSIRWPRSAPARPLPPRLPVPLCLTRPASACPRCTCPVPAVRLPLFCLPCMHAHRVAGVPRQPFPWLRYQACLACAQMPLSFALLHALLAPVLPCTRSALCGVLQPKGGRASVHPPKRCLWMPSHPSETHLEQKRSECAAGEGEELVCTWPYGSPLPCLTAAGRPAASPPPTCRWRRR